MHGKIGQDRNQLFTTCLDDYIEPDNPVREIERIISEIVSSFDHRYLRGQSRRGCRAYSTEDLLCLYVYGYLNGITSSRQLERAARINLEVSWLLKNNHPSYKTIADFRKDNQEIVMLVFYQLVEKLSLGEYITGKLVVVDGNKTKANAKREMHSAKKLKKQIEAISKDVETYLRELEEADKKEAEAEKSSDSSKDDTDEAAPISSSIQERLAEAQANLSEKQSLLDQMTESKKNYLSPTDTDASLVTTRRGKVAGYNPQYTVDSAHHMIMDVLVSTDSNDKRMLYPSLKHLVEHTSIVPEVILADKGYTNFEDIRKVHNEISNQVYVSLQRSSRDSLDLLFEYDSHRNIYICPQGRTLTLYKKHVKVKNSFADYYKCESCAGCPQTEQCRKDKRSRKIDRIFLRYEHQEFIDAYKEKMKQANLKNLMKTRKSIIEHVFGTISCNMHYNGFRLRSMAKVQIEAYLHAIAYDLKRLFNIVMPPGSRPFIVNNSILRDNSVQNRERSLIFNVFSQILLSWLLKLGLLSRPCHFDHILTEA